MDCLHSFRGQSPCGGASAQPTSSCHRAEDAASVPGDPDWSRISYGNVPPPSSIVIHGLRWHRRRLYHFYRHISNICPLWNVSIVKAWHLFVMNYFIMLVKAVIKCVPFYDNAVMEGGRHKSCLGLFFHLANAETDK